VLLYAPFTPDPIVVEGRPLARQQPAPDDFLFSNSYILNFGLLMHQFLRHRRTWIGLLASTMAFVLFYHSSPRSLTASGSQEIVTQDTHTVNDQPYATQHSVELYSSEPPAHRHSVTWSSYEEIPQSRVFAHIPGMFSVPCLPPKFTRLL
jgi:hypothetical protein